MHLSLHPPKSSRNWGPRKCLRSKDLWGRGGISAFAAAVLRAGLPGKPLTFRRSDPDRARTDDPQRDRLVLYQMSYGRILHVASRGVAPGDIDYYTASRGRCQHPICIFCNFGGERPTFGPASCNLQFQTSLHHVIGRPMTIQFRSGSAPLMRRKFICIPHRELL